MKRRNRSIWEANIWEANSYKSDVFKKPSISHDISSEHVSRPSTLRPNNLKSQIRIRTSLRTRESSNVKNERATAQESGWPIPDAEQQAINTRRREHFRPSRTRITATSKIRGAPAQLPPTASLRTRSPLPSTSPPKRTNRVTRPDTATLTPTRRRFQQLRKTQTSRIWTHTRYSRNNPAHQPNLSTHRPSGPQHAYPSERRNTGRSLIRTRS